MIHWCQDCLEEQAVGVPPILGVECLRRRSNPLAQREMPVVGLTKSPGRCNACDRYTDHRTRARVCLACATLAVERSIGANKGRAFAGGPKRKRGWDDDADARP